MDEIYFLRNFKGTLDYRYVENNRLILDFAYWMKELSIIVWDKLNAWIDVCYEN